MKKDKLGFAKRLNLACDHAQLPPLNKGRAKILAKMVKMTERGTGKHLNGESCPPSNSKSYAIYASRLNVSLSWLITGIGDMLSSTNNPSLASEKYTHNFPIYNFEDLNKITKTPIDYLSIDSSIEDLIGFKVNTEAMSPRFPINSTILLKTSDFVVHDGDFVVADIKAMPTLIFRQFIKANSLSYLIAHNPKFETIQLSQEDKIIGKLMTAILSFDF